MYPFQTERIKSIAGFFLKSCGLFFPPSLFSCCVPFLIGRNPPKSLQTKLVVSFKSIKKSKDDDDIDDDGRRKVKGFQSYSVICTQWRELCCCTLLISHQQQQRKRRQGRKKNQYTIRGIPSSGYAVVHNRATHTHTREVYS